MAAVYLSLRFETYVQSSREHPQESYNVSFPFNTHFSCFESLFPSIVVFCREVLFFFLNIRYWEPIFVFHTYGRGRHDQSYWRRIATGVASVVVIYCFSFFPNFCSKPHIMLQISNEMLHVPGFSTHIKVDVFIHQVPF